MTIQSLVSRILASTPTYRMAIFFETCKNCFTERHPRIPIFIWFSGMYNTHSGLTMKNFWFSAIQSTFPLHYSHMALNHRPLNGFRCKCQICVLTHTSKAVDLVTSIVTRSTMRWKAEARECSNPNRNNSPSFTSFATCKWSKGKGIVSDAF